MAVSRGYTPQTGRISTMRIAKRGTLTFVALLALVVTALEVSAGTSQNITHSTCEAYGHTHEYAGYVGASTALTAGRSAECWRYLQFSWWDDFFQEWVDESATWGYSNQWDQFSYPTDGKSYHRLSRDGVGGEANVYTNSWQ